MARLMKDSGIEWIGEIPRDWEVIKLRRLGLFTASGIDKITKPNEPLVKIINYTDVYGNKTLELNDKKYMVVSAPENKIKEHCVKEGDLIFTPSSETIEDIGVSAVVTEDLVNTAFSYHVLRFQFNREVVKSYKKYLCNNYYLQNYFSHQAIGTIRKTLNRDDFKEALVILPPIPTQQRIADYLDEKCKEIDSIIENTKVTIEEYKKYKQSVITEAVTKGLDPNVEMKNSGIEWNKEIPYHWQIANGRRLFDLRKDKAMPNDRQLTASQKYGIMYQDEFMKLENQRVVTVQKDFDILKHVEPNDFVISMRSFQGGLEYSQLRGCISSAYVMLIPNEKVYCPYFRWLFKCVKYINALQSTSNLVRDGQAMRYSNFIQVPLFFIPIKEQKEIAEYLDEKCAEIDNLISKKQQIITEIESYKKSLIYERVTGKRSVEASGNNKTSTIIYPLFPALLATEKKRFSQAVLASKIIEMTNSSKFGRVKLEKILYTIETHIGFDFDTDYKRQVAGPLDGSIYQCENMISRRNKWFNINENKKTVKYSPAKDMANYKNYYNKYFIDYNHEIERIINIFKPLSTDQAEIIATLYASWNDFTIGGKSFTDDDIVYDVLNNWHESKKRFSKDIWFQAIEQMRKLDLVPKGYGKKTIMP